MARQLRITGIGGREESATRIDEFCVYPGLIQYVVYKGFKNAEFRSSRLDNNATGFVWMCVCIYSWRGREEVVKSILENKTNIRSYSLKTLVLKVSTSRKDTDNVVRCIIFTQFKEIILYFVCCYNIVIVSYVHRRSCCRTTTIGVAFENKFIKMAYPRYTSVVYYLH